MRDITSVSGELHEHAVVGFIAGSVYSLECILVSVEGFSCSHYCQSGLAVPTVWGRGRDFNESGALQDWT